MASKGSKNTSSNESESTVQIGKVQVKVTKSLNKSAKSNTSATEPSNKSKLVADNKDREPDSSVDVLGAVGINVEPVRMNRPKSAKSQPAPASGTSKESAPAGQANSLQILLANLKQQKASGAGSSTSATATTVNITSSSDVKGMPESNTSSAQATRQANLLTVQQMMAQARSRLPSTAGAQPVSNVQHPLLTQLTQSNTASATLSSSVGAPTLASAPSVSAGITANTNKSIRKRSSKILGKTLASGHVINKYGRNWDAPDSRDMIASFKETSSSGLSKLLTSSSNKLNNLPPVEDQGDLGSCTAFATLAAVEYDLMNNDNSTIKVKSKAVHHNAITAPAKTPATTEKVSSATGLAKADKKASKGDSKETPLSEEEKKKAAKAAKRAAGQAAKEKAMKKVSASMGDSSEMFQYYNERLIEGTVGTDSGASIRSAIKASNRYGICPENLCPYNEADFANKPSDAAYAAAKLVRVLTYRRLGQTINQIKLAIDSGVPFVGGIEVFSSFESDTASQTGTIPVPNQATEEYLGGHALMFYGYDDKKQLINFQNSWGTGWGNDGRGTIPYAYLTDETLAGDFWIITTISTPY